MKKNVLHLFLLSAALLLQLSNAGAQDATAPKQYGKPFAGVPDRRDVTLYQVNMRTFGKNGDLKGVTERLDSIKALGANVVYLMPVYPVGKLKAVNSPYCISDYLTVSPEFGTLADLRQLVDKAHSLKLAVMLDWVGNHTAFDHPWTKNKNWYLQDSTGNILSPPNTGWRDVAQLNYKNADMRREMIKSMKYWVLAANIDGFRCDFSDGPPFDFWKEAIDTLKRIPNHKLLMLSEGGRADHYKAGFDYNFGFNFFGNLKQVFEHGRSVLSIDSLNAVDAKATADGQQMVRYTTNHDVNGSDGTPQQLFGGQNGSMAAFVVIAYMQSIPMIYNGQEVGTPYQLVFPFTEKKVDWSLNPAVTAEYKKIIALRNSSKAIRRGKLTSYSSVDVCAFTKEDGGEKVFVLSNLRNKAVSYTVPSALVNAKWNNAFNGSKTNVGAAISLQPYEYLVLKN
ncbi:alpha-amylase family glycosyl hydrolase [Mucilaginibacter pedocola]|uniref:Glycosyl hydrolase family 13 catalytic domain-containing protein n=1 Tax=Mucilaginibacter pedocola TaxID=1792845 RepID=A0A1S9P6P1_9SPHI|nr:alpha-amylase family glycosyl hydrolase [Mucilaginibacter pedocola]OOQ56507.1 hypothetical protein BC343_18870 [Mucilaginibacter pedocola]